MQQVLSALLPFKNAMDQITVASFVYEHLIPAGAGVGGGRPGEASGVGCKPGGQIVRAVEIEQRLNAGGGGFAQGAAAAV
jgi:hypothetical protein